jgi:hypothetical protein
VPSSKCIGDSISGATVNSPALISLSLLLVLLSVPVIFAQKAAAHSGGLDSSGGHYCWTDCLSKGEIEGVWHYHGGGSGLPDLDLNLPDYDYSPPPASSPPIGGADRWIGRHFSSPSGNVQCRYEPRKKQVGCSSLSAGMTAWVSKRFLPWTTYTVISTRATPIPYGDYWSMGGFECWSYRSGMECFPPNGSDTIQVNSKGAYAYK